MTNVSKLFQLVFSAKNRLDRLFGKDKYRLVAESFADADFKAADDLPPAVLALGEAGTIPDQYGFVELNHAEPRRARIDFSLIDEPMLLRTVIDRLSCSKAPDDLLKALRELVPQVAAASTRANRPPPKPEKPATPPATK